MSEILDSKIAPKPPLGIISVSMETIIRDGGRNLMAALCERVKVVNLIFDKTRDCLIVIARSDEFYECPPVKHYKAFGFGPALKFERITDAHFEALLNAQVLGILLEA